MVVALQIVNGKLGQHSGLAGLGRAGLHLLGGKMRKRQRQIKQAAAAAGISLSISHSSFSETSSLERM